MLVKTLGTHEYTAALGDTVADVRLGGELTATKFVPELFASKWGGEAWWRISHPATLVTDQVEAFGDGRLDLTVGNLRHSYWVKPDGSLEYEIGFAAKPLTNVLEFAVECPSELQWAYQPALTEKEEEDSYRPDDIVGSYAVYWPQEGHHKDSGGHTIRDYRTGKYAHIKRPKVTDNLGAWAWGDLLWQPGGQGGILRLTLPQAFLNNATYPIRVGPNFGHESIGATNLSADHDRVYAVGPHTPGGAGTLTSVTIYFAVEVNGTQATFGCYDDDTTYPDDLVGDSDGATYDTGWSWKEQAVGGSLAAAPHWFAKNNDDTGYGYFKYDGSQSGYYIKYAASAYSHGTLENPFPAGASIYTDYKASAYGTYTAAAGGVIRRVPRHLFSRGAA